MARHSGYDDFEIVLHAQDAGGYVSWARSPFGPAGGKFPLPFNDQERLEVLAAIRWQVLRSSSAWRVIERVHRPPEPAVAPPTEREVGAKLFASLFSGEVRDRFRESMAPVRDRRASRRHGVRLRLSFLPGEHFAPVATLPWELMLDDGVFLARDKRVPLVRSLAIGHAPDPAPARLPLQVLLIDSAPKDLGQLATRREGARIKKALRARSEIEVEVLTHPNAAKLRERLAKKDYQIVHFMGHGNKVGARGERFALYFEGADREAEAVTDEMIAEILKDIRDLRLVVLNSCWSGAVPLEQGEDPYAGVGAALLRREIPAAVAMQFPISDVAAIEFSGGFYASLAAGDPVEEAVTKGRLAILDQNGTSLEWVTPILFLPGDGQLFDFGTGRTARSGGGRPATAKARARAPERPLTLGVWSFPEPFLAIEKPDFVLDLRELFERGLIREHRLWQEEVFPRLREFLLRHRSPGRPIELDLAAHATLAFAAGYVLDTKSGLDMWMYQRGQVGKPVPWRAEAGPARPGPLWQDAEDLRPDPGVHDVALAIGVALDVLADVELYLRRSQTPVGRIVPMTLHPRPAPNGVENGLHGLQLAHDLGYRIRLRTLEERAATLHLFAAAPNGLLFFLGQLAKGFGRIQLYEHRHGAPEPGAYIPSLQLPLLEDVSAGRL